MEVPPTPSRSDPARVPGFKIRHLRWYICALLFFASAINYIDRQTVSVLKGQLQGDLGWSESDYGWIIFSFQVAYAIMMTIWGRVIDRLGTRLGYALTVAWWSVAAMSHALARGALSFGAARFFLGASEAGNTPAAIKAAAEWFPPKERALAAGILNAGTNVGAMLAPPLVVWLTLRWDWQVAFIVTGALGFVWVIVWLFLYHAPAQHPHITEDELHHVQAGTEDAVTPPQARTPWMELLRYRQTWGFIIAKFMTDPVWWFYVFWLPSYLQQARGFSLAMIGYFAWNPFPRGGCRERRGRLALGLLDEARLAGQPGAENSDGCLRLLHAGSHDRGLCPRGLDGRGSNLAGHLRAPGMVVQPLHRGFRHFP